MPSAQQPAPEARRAPAEATPESLPITPFDPTAFHARLITWYKRNARKLPWRGIKDPYGTWLSEIMLQQTRVATVIDRYTAFLKRFPTIQSLAEAEELDVLAQWSGLGYYRRARMLHTGAQFVVREFAGKLPRTSAALRTLPGIGDYTAAAIASIAFREQIAVLDGNVERVLFRILGQPEEKTTAARKQLMEVAQSLVPAPGAKTSRTNLPGDHNQAMMELGATICLPRGPLCLQCPVVDFCKTRGEHPTPARSKQQSRTVAYLLALRKRGTTTEVLLERRPADASLMPDMLELPALPLDVAEAREPVLRLRHAITNTNYYVLVFADGAYGAPLATGGEHDTQAELLDNEDEAVFVATESEQADTRGLLQAVPASEEMLLWTATAQLPAKPLTGLARKVLQRLGVMATPRPLIR
jgi:A/G-specific adenine glycosylase